MAAAAAAARFCKLKFKFRIALDRVLRRPRTMIVPEMRIEHYALAAVLPIAFLSAGIVSAQDGPDSVRRGTKEFTSKVLISGLAGPWEVTWGADKMLWVTERTGKRIVRIDPFTGKATVAVTIGEVSAPGAQDGLLGMALGPDLFRDTGNNYVYAAYTYVDSKRRQRFFPGFQEPPTTTSTARSCGLPTTSRQARCRNPPI